MKMTHDLYCMTEDGAHNDDIFFTTVKHITLENLLA
jgi:hypothetical protein